MPLGNFRGKAASSKQLKYNTTSIQVQKDTVCYEEKNEFASGTLTKPMAVARWLEKYSGAGARSGKYRSDIPSPTRKPCVSRSCHIERLKEARVNPTDIISTPAMVIVLGVNRRRILRRHSRVEGVVEAQVPCSMRDITGLTRMPPAQVSP